MGPRSGSFRLAFPAFAFPAFAFHRFAFQRFTFRPFALQALMLFAFALLVLGLAVPASAAPPAREGELLIKFKANASAATIDAIRADLGASSIRRFTRIHAEHDRLTVRSVDDAIARYRNHPAVEFIEPNYIVSAVRTPNDPRFAEMWGLRNTGQTGGVPGADIDAPAAWEVTTGSQDVVVAIIDTGTDYNHPDLASNIFANTGEIAGNGVDDDANGFIDDVRGWDFVNHDNDPMDDNGHGTHVAGTIGAVGNNGIGVTGVAWSVRLMPLKFLGSDGFGSTADAVACIEYGAMMGVDVMNNSWGGGGYSQALFEAIQDANAAGVLFVAAAGNASNNNDVNIFYPAGYDVPNVVSVAATNSTDQLAYFSNYGATTVDLAAPGQDILSTMRFSNYGLLSGTSMAAPHVSGAFALIRSRFPGIPASAAKALLLNSVDPIPSLNGVVLSGGRLNAVRALEGPDSLPPDPVFDLAAAGTGSNRVTLTWTARGDDGATGTASGYDIRYAITPITEATFTSSSRFPYATPPLPSGSAETVQVTGLVASTTYFFAIKVLDEYGNASGISNVATATTLEPPNAQVTPASLDADLLTGGQTTRTLTLSNPTGGTLEFSLDVDYGAGPGGPPPPPPPDSLGGTRPTAWSAFADLYDAATAPPPIGGLNAAVLLPGVIQDPAGDGGPVDLTALRARSANGQLDVEMEFATTLNPYDMGGALSLDIDQDPSTGYPPAFGNPFQNIGAEYEFYFFDLASNVVVLYTTTGYFVGAFPVEIGAHTLRFSAPLALIGNDDGSMNVTGVLGTSYGPTDWFPDSGHGTIHGFQWLSVEPATGIVPPGGSIGVTVSFDAAGLLGGGYDATLRVASNDPDDPVVTVPVHMDVTGAPDILLSVTALDFGDVYLTASRTDSIVVTNAGTDRLDITEIGSTTPDFEVGAGPFSLAPGERRTVAVTFRPSVPSAITGSLRIRSNDSDESEVLVALSGTGLVPPEIELTPGSFQASLLTGQSQSQTLHITNSGGSNLALQLDTRRDVAAAGAGPAPAGTPGQLQSQTSDDTPVAPQPGAADAPVPVLVIQNTDAWGINMSAFLQGRFGITPTVIQSSQIATTDFSPYDLIITVGDESSGYYNAVSANVAKFAAFAQSGGVIQYQLATQGDNVAIAGGALVQYGNQENTNRNVLPGHPIMAGLPELLQGNWANHCTLAQLPAGAQILTRTQNSNLPTTVEYRVGAGTVIATGMTWEFLYNYGYNSGPMLYQATAYSLSQAGPKWLAVSPTTANLPPGGSIDVTVSFDAAGLFGGPYDGSVRVISNDPDESELLVPAHLDVTGVPLIAIDPTAITFAPVFVGQVGTRMLTVENPGSDDLSVQISSSDVAFAATPTAFVLPPRQTQPVTVTFTPAAAGAQDGTLHLTHNAAGSPTDIPLHGVGLIPPVVTVSPDSIHVDAFTNDVRVEAMTIGNAGGSDLVFTLEAGSRPAAVQTSSDPPPAKGQTDTRVGDPVTAGNGGPDQFGYRWIDSDQAGGPIFSWLDIESTGTPIAITGDDAISVPIPISFPFSFYGVDHSSFRVCTNGFVTFTGAGAPYVNYPLPSPYAPPNVLAAFWNDLYFAQDSRAHYRDDGTRVIVQFSRVQHLGGGGPYTFQIVFYRSGAVLYQYLSMGEPRSYATVGIQNGAMNDGLTVVFNSNYIHDQLAVRFAAAPTWLSLSPLSGTVPAGGSFPVQATVDATGLLGGDYPASVRIQSNDPLTPLREVPVTLHVTGVPDVTLSPSTLDFGTIYVGQTQSRNLQITNIGSDRLVVTGLSAGHPDYSIVPSSFALEPLQSMTVSVTYAPSAPGSANSSLTLSSNDPTPPSPVALIAGALVPPEIEFTPGSFQASLFTGQTQSQTLHISNSGGSNLSLQLDTGREVVATGTGPAPAGTPGQLQSQTSDDNAVVSQPGAADAPVPVLVIQETDAWGITMAPFLQARFGIIPTVIRSSQIATTDFSPYDLVITVGDESFAYYDAISANVAKFEAFVRGGGVVQYQLATQGSNVAIAGGAFVQFGFSESYNRNVLPDHPIMAGLPELLQGNWANHCIVTQLPPDARILTRTVSSNLPTTVEYRLGAGTVIATGMTWEFLYNYGYNSGPMLYQATAYSLTHARPEWLAVSPSTAIVPPGGSIDVTVSFDATGLESGDHRGSVRVASNDIDEGLLLLPASLHVIGVPFVSVRPASLDFDTLYVGVHEVRTLEVINSGTEPLDVSSITAGFPEYTITPTTFSLDPAESVTVTVDLLGGTAGVRNTDLTIQSNSPVSPDLVPMRAVVLIPPRMVAPLLVEATTPPGGRAHKTLSICNQGGSDLRFQIAGSGVREATATSYLQVAKGEPDPRPAIEGQGGPDGFGHTWIDSEAPTGPVFNWVDITTTGTRVPFSAGADDENLGPYPIGFGFSYYGRLFTQFRVCTNGWISFTNSSSSFAYQPVPNAGTDVPENLIAPAWGDYYLAPSSGIYYKAEPTRLIVQFHDVVPVGDFSPYPIDFEVILYPDARIVYQYRTVELPVAGMMIGMQNQDRDDGITIAFNSSHYLRSNRAIEIVEPVAPPPEWLALSPLQGVVPPGGCAPIAIDLDAADLEPGTYEATIRMTTNDPASPTLNSSILLHVGEVEAASADLEPNTLNLDSNGRFVSCFVELPPSLDPNRVVLSTVRLQGTVPTSQAALRIGDYNQNSIPDLQFLFDRTAVEAILPEGPSVQLAVTGEVENTTCFVARDVIRTIRPRVLAPNGGEVLLAASATTIRWENPNGWNPDYAAVYYSANQESTWIAVSEHVEGQSVAWTVPGVTGSLVRARVRVYLFDEEGVMGYDSSDNPFVITNSITGVEVAETTLPTSYELLQNAPNPFNPVTTIHYSMPASGPAKLEIFRVDGSLVRTLVNGAMAAGRHQAAWNGRDDHGRPVASGMYVYRLRAGSFTESKRMILMK